MCLRLLMLVHGVVLCVWSLLRCRTKGISSLLNTLEAALAALLVTLLGHEANCRRMMMVRQERGGE